MKEKSKSEMNICQWFQEIIVAQPNPPREISFKQVLKNVWRKRSIKFMSVFGLILILSNVLLFIPPNDRYLSSIPAILVIVLIVAFEFMMILFPILVANRYTFALKYGEVGMATIEEIHFEGIGSHRTIDASFNGFAKGLRRVQTTSFQYKEEFECDEPWALSLRSEQKIKVLVHPNKAKTIFELGPIIKDNIPPA